MFRARPGADILSPGDGPKGVGESDRKGVKGVKGPDGRGRGEGEGDATGG
jgi:hypothetical protein